MNLIVFDLEWNMGNAPKTFNYHGAELTLRGEIIQIGAVRVDENGDVLDTFEMTLRPRIFRKLHWRIAEVTGLSQGELEAGVPIAEGLRRFQEWAGPDAEFAEWGLDDVPVLKQNLFLYNMDESWKAWWTALALSMTAISTMRWTMPCTPQKSAAACRWPRALPNTRTPPPS